MARRHQALTRYVISLLIGHPLRETICSLCQTRPAASITSDCLHLYQLAFS